MYLIIKQIKVSFFDRRLSDFSIILLSMFLYNKDVLVELLDIFGVDMSGENQDF